MVNFKSPIVAEHDYNVVLKNLWHTTNGIFIWEYFSTLDYELDVIRGRRPYRWTIWIYSLTRAATLLAVILSLINFNVTKPINCQAWVIFELIFAYVGLAAASVLIVFRIFAIWNKNKFIVGLTIGVWITNVAVIIQGIVRLRSEWNPFVGSCVLINTEDNKANIVVTLISDIILLSIMLVGLLLLHHESGVQFPLGRLLWNQGIIWLVIATAAEVPPSVFIILNLSDPWNLMFQFPSLITMSIAATRMYRSLSDFVFGSTDIFSNVLGSPQAHDRAPSKVNTHTSIQLNQIEVAVDAAHERHHISRTMASTNDQLDDRSHGSKFSSDLESAVENRV